MKVILDIILEDTARYAGLLLAPAAKDFFALQAKKKSLLCGIGPFFFCNFWCPVETLVTFSSDHSNFEGNPKKPKNPKIIQKLKKKNKKTLKRSKQLKKFKKKIKKKKIKKKNL